MWYLLYIFTYNSNLRAAYQFLTIFCRLMYVYRVYKKKLNKFEIALNVAKRLKV